MATLNEGDLAPDFTGVDQQGRTVKLSDYRGKKVVLYFYPKDNTPGCTAQACSLRDHYAELKQMGLEVIGVSTDSVASHQKFEQKYQLPFTLIADTDKQIVQAYGVYAPKKFMGKSFLGTVRTTFIINEQGVIEKIIRKPNTARHAQEVMAAVRTS
ncbi:MAG: thioredoxin-dependent thiol peroxidase [Thermoflavifilum sp.]|uniref:thioredoxin-dependent thiol peroxidase n=1 Tax=Thermoflavifilum sp. TaxID=1968839 RepID=UPI0018A5289A|nr:thioredoxin-dependent thiol peroxidase [Thermoflavifilum sp.]QOR75026.1 MAG: thioredoxin-dependent thiol peroxidase [Thermoflavifilum sp.]